MIYSIIVKDISNYIHKRKKTAIFILFSYFNTTITKIIKYNTCLCLLFQM